MKRVYLLFLVLLGFILFSCGGSKNFVLENPEAGKSLLVGAVMLENNGLDELFQPITENIIVVLVGKYTENGEEKEQGYRVKTDENGYFILQNVSPGAYIIKGFEVDVGFGRRLFISSRWDGNTQIFHPVDNIIDYTVRVWPPANSHKVMDMEINYFVIDQALRVATKKYKMMQNLTGAISGSTYTMANPVTYFQAKYPQAKWFE